MKKNTSIICTILLIVFTAIVSFVFGRQSQQQGYVVEHEKDIAKEQPGSHNGLGITTGYIFFEKVPALQLSFRKRVMKPGSSIGYHLQKEDEIYYIASGTGTMKMNGESFPVKAGDAILTRPGSSHGLEQTGKNDLVVIINYMVKK
jgi:mannose-6-phosphate isomerase-like protein (cupin superfamily)